MRKLVYFMHTSLDGFVAGPKGEMDWINVDDEIFEYAGRQTREADTALYGRITYEMMQSYWPTAEHQPNASAHDVEHSRWYNSVTKIVISKSLQGKTLPDTIIIGDNLEDSIKELKQRNGRNILMFGSPQTAHALMHHNLIDEYWVFVNPVILGEGIPLFSSIRERLTLKLAECKVFSSGVVGLCYTT